MNVKTFLISYEFSLDYCNISILYVLKQVYFSSIPVPGSKIKKNVTRQFKIFLTLFRITYNIYFVLNSQFFCFKIEN